MKRRFEEMTAKTKKTLENGSRCHDACSAGSEKFGKYAIAGGAITIHAIYA